VSVASPYISGCTFIIETSRSDPLTKPIRILHPILSIRRIDRRSIVIDIIKAHIGPIHDIQAPQRRILDEEILHHDIGYIPKDEGHRPSRLRVALLDVVPGVAVAVDSAGAVPFDGDVLPCDDEGGVVVLEGDGVGVVAPVVDVVG
jgi:hypothetical protein